MPSCSVPECVSLSTHFHIFPHPHKQPERFRQWLELVKNDELSTLAPMVVYNNYKVCSEHFLPAHVSRNNRLVRAISVLPQLHLPPQTIGLNEIMNKVDDSATPVDSSVPPTINDLLPQNLLDTELNKTVESNPLLANELSDRMTTPSVPTADKRLSERTECLDFIIVDDDVTRAASSCNDEPPTKRRKIESNVEKLIMVLEKRERNKDRRHKERMAIEEKKVAFLEKILEKL